MGYMSTVEQFNELPEEVRAKTISIMGAYSEVIVTYEYGRYDVGTCVCLKRYYAPDHKSWFFSKEELEKQYKKEIKAEEDRFYEESKDCNWELMNN